jgi:predicted DNA-binding transcriptional regulator YafY
MDKVSRQHQLINYLQSAKYFPISIQNIANRFNCSERTIRRDITSNWEKGSPWYILENTIRLDKSRIGAFQIHEHWFTQEELEALFVLIQTITNLSPGTLKNHTNSFISRLDQLLKEKISQTNLASKIKLIEIADRPIPLNIFQNVISALLESKKIKIKFWNRHSNQTSYRVISPIQLVRYKDNWKLDAWCHSKEAIRTFSLEAIQDAILLKEEAIHVEESLLKNHLQSSYGIFSGQPNCQAVIQFSPYIARWIQYENWHPQQQSEWDTEGNYILKLPYNQDQEIIQDILKYGAHAKVLQPIELQEKIKQKLKDAIEVYSQ